MPIDQIGTAGIANGAIVAADLAAGVPTRSQLPAGCILQVVTSQYSTFTSSTAAIPLDNTPPQNTEGTEVLTATITPTSTTSKLVITAQTTMGVSIANWAIISLFQDSGVNAIAANTMYITTNTASAILPLTYSMTAGTTNATTFRLRYGPGTGATTTAYINGSSSALFNGTLYTTLTITEVAA